ncbi:MAG TPA: hypothetical protein VLK36_16675 [Gaiellaceae bacterium]|nr:hypothetical protein [Gaiellaceae bacterium]
MRRNLIAVAALASSLVAAPLASADGLPVLGVDDGSSGVAAPAGASRYVTIPTGNGTLVERIRRAGGQVLATHLVAGEYTIPAVAYDGSAGGLSGDRHTLVLIEPRRAFPRARTRLLVLDAPSLRVRAHVDLAGDFSFDAVSPNGARIYLIDYVAPQDPTRYTVRSYSVPALRLEPAPIVDPRSPGEKMRGNPVSRAAGPGGRWAYTLYDGAGGTPFVHALDTVHARARCIDLDGLDPSIVGRLRLRTGDGGRAVEVLDGRRELIRLDTRTFAVGAPRATSSWRVPAAAGLAAALLVAAGAWLLLRRRRPLVADLAS